MLEQRSVARSALEVRTLYESSPFVREARDRYDVELWR